MQSYGDGNYNYQLIKYGLEFVNIHDYYFDFNHNTFFIETLPEIDYILSLPLNFAQLSTHWLLYWFQFRGKMKQLPIFCME